MLDQFINLNDQESKKLISEFWESQEYLVKIRILLSTFTSYSITKLEARNINKLWGSLSLEKRKDIYNSQYKYRFTQ